MSCLFRRVTQFPVSVSVSRGWQAGQSPRRTLKPVCLTSSGQVLAFLCDLLVSQQHISQLFVQAMAAAGLGYRKSGKSRAKSSTQGWSPNSGQAAEDESGSFVDVLVSEQGQQSSSSGLTLPQQHQQTRTHMQAASSLDQPQGGLVQCQPTGNNPAPPSMDALGQYQPTGNNETSLAGDDLNSDVIVNAQLTHLISRDDAAQGQDAPNVPDVLMPDAPAVHDIATPRRIIGGRCRKWCISARPASVKRKCAACCMCGIRFTHGEARLQQWSNRETNHHYLHAHCVNGVSGMIMNCTRSWLMIRKQLMQSPANGTPSPGQRQTQKYLSRSLRIRIKPQQLRHLMTSETYVDEKRTSAWMKRSWTSSGLNTSHGTASKICVARRMSNLPRVSGLRCSKPDMPYSKPSFTTIQPLQPQNQPGKRWFSAAGSFWDDPQSTPLRATAHTFWMRDWSFLALRIDLLSGPWYAPNVMLLRCRTRHAERTSSRCSHVFAKLLAHLQQSRSALFTCTT